MHCAIRPLAAAFCILAAPHAPPAEARRVALVIGNAAYKIGPLRSPVDDATAVAEAFEKQLKFDKVILGKNLGAEAFRWALRELAREAKDADIGVVYFTGHGVEGDGRTFLIPVDATLKSADDVAHDAVELGSVLGALARARRLKVVLVDTSLDDPFSGRRGTVSRLPDIGLGDNALIFFATEPGGHVVDPLDQRYSPLAEAFLRHLVTPGLDVRRLFGLVSEHIRLATGGRQEPFLYGRLDGEEVYLNPPAR
jgi:uncharacterized caspase-like protein